MNLSLVCVESSWARADPTVPEQPMTMIPKAMAGPRMGRLGAAKGLDQPRTHAVGQKPHWARGGTGNATSVTPSFRPLVWLPTTPTQWRPWRNHSGHRRWLHRPCGAMSLSLRCASHNDHRDIIAHRGILGTSIELSVATATCGFPHVARKQCVSPMLRNISRTRSGVRRFSALCDVGLFRRTAQRRIPSRSSPTVAFFFLVSLIGIFE